MNDAQTEATERVRAAIVAHQEAFGVEMDGGFVGDFAYVVQIARIEPSDQTEYLVGFHTSPLPTHVAVGLFDVGHDIAGADGYDKL